MTRRYRTILAATGAALALAACEKRADRPAAPPAENAAPTEAEGAQRPAADWRAVAEAAVNNPARPDADRVKDAARRPVEALVFMRAEPGLSIFEIEAGGGWYTELLSRAAGPGGRVVMQNPQGFLEFVEKDIDARLKDGRLANVVQSISNFDALEAEDASIDLVTWVQGPHELYFKPSDGVTLGDPDTAYAEIFRILKPGGLFVAIDHSAISGAPETTGDLLHRVDKAIVIEAADKAGLTLVDEAAFLANPADDRTKSVFDPEIRGRTDQFVLRFRKPRDQSSNSSQTEEVDETAPNDRVRHDPRTRSLASEPDAEEKEEEGPPDRPRLSQDDEATRSEPRGSEPQHGSQPQRGSDRNRDSRNDANRTRNESTRRNPHWR